MKSTDNQPMSAANERNPMKCLEMWMLLVFGGLAIFGCSQPRTHLPNRDAAISSEADAEELPDASPAESGSPPVEGGPSERDAASAEVDVAAPLMDGNSPPDAGIDRPEKDGPLADVPSPPKDAQGDLAAADAELKPPIKVGL